MGRKMQHRMTMAIGAANETYTSTNLRVNYDTTTGNVERQEKAKRKDEAKDKRDEVTYAQLKHDVK